MPSFECLRKEYFNNYNIYDMGIGDWGLGPIPNPQSPIPNPQSPIPNFKFKNISFKFHNKLN